MSHEGTAHMNEDAVGSVPAAAWVVDAATPLDPPFALEGVTSAAWYSQRVSQELASTFSEDVENVGEAFVREALVRVQRTIAEQLGWTLREDRYCPPSASLAIVSNVDDLVEICTVGDVEVRVLLTDGDVVRIAHELPDKIVNTPDGAVQWGAIEDLHDQRQAITDDGHGHSHVLSVRPLRADAIRYETFLASSIACVILYSDGVTALIEKDLDHVLRGESDLATILADARLTRVEQGGRVDDASALIAIPLRRED